MYLQKQQPYTHFTDKHICLKGVPVVKRIELFKKTGICFTALALSAMVGAANPLMTAFAADSPTTEAAASAEEGGDQNDNTDDGGGSTDDSGSGSDETPTESTSESSSEGGGDDTSDDGNKQEAPQEDSSDKGDSQEENTPTGNPENESSVDEGSQEEVEKVTRTPGDSNTGDDGSQEEVTKIPKTHGDDNSAVGDSGNTTVPVNPTAPSESPAADTQTNQPQQTGTTLDPTGKYKDKGTTLNPGETPTGYDQALNYGGSNADLIASQNIVSGLSIMKDDFRFRTVDKDAAISSKKQSVFEEMDVASREIGLLSENDTLYILSEEEDGWLYIESGNVRGFIPKDDIKKVKDSDAAEQIPSFAEESVPASENSAFTYKRCTTKSTVIDKDYAVADTDTMIMESTNENAREIGHLAPGSLCYVLMQVDEKWAYVESGNVRGFARTSNLTTGTAAKKTIQQNGEVNMTTAEEYIAPADNKALYYTLNSVNDGAVFSSVRTDIVEKAAECIGNPYVWGGTSLTNGADCSGFVQSLYALFGYSIPRVADAQSRYGTQIPISDAAPGDLIFFAANGYVYHVALYAGDGMTIEAYSENRGIIATPIGNRDAVWATRVIED